MESGPQGLRITSIRDLQIVNGAQTTASLHNAARKNDVSGITVQMKLSVVNREEVDEVVPKISRFANSQNRISDADFFSNHPFHIRIEGISRRLFAPSVDGEFTQTRWFYERARGQYQAERANLSVARRREFDRMHPRSQMFTKTDLAKFANAWHGKPHILSKGAQKNFSDFASHVDSAWTRDDDSFGERYFKHLIATAIVFRATERMVSNARWYDGGYRANIVAYTIAKLDSIIQKASRLPDFGDIWTNQDINPEMEVALLQVGASVSRILTNPPDGMANISEWAKKTACWTAVETLAIPGVDVHPFTRDGSEEARRKKGARQETRLLKGIEAQMTVVNAGSETWKQLLDWGIERKALSDKERDILEACARLERKLPSVKRCEVAMRVMQRLNKEYNCSIGADLLSGSSLA